MRRGGNLRWWGWRFGGLGVEFDGPGIGRFKYLGIRDRRCTMMESVRGGSSEKMQRSTLSRLLKCREQTTVDWSRAVVGHGSGRSGMTRYVTRQHERGISKS